MPKVIHYRDKCIGCGICYELHPGLWHMSKKDGKARLLQSINKKGVFILPVSNSIIQQLQDIADTCPVKIIKIV